MRTFLRVMLRPWRLALFVAAYLVELVEANAVLAWEVVTPTHNLYPTIVKAPIRASTPLEITALANLISFTPGTLTLEVAEDSSAIYVHALQRHGAESVRVQVARLERRLLWVLR